MYTVDMAIKIRLRQNTEVRKYELFLVRVRF